MLPQQGQELAQAVPDPSTRTQVFLALSLDSVTTVCAIREPSMSVKCWGI